MARKSLTVKELLKALEGRGTKITRRTLINWQKAGCPHHKGPGRRGRVTFELAEVVGWLERMGRTGEMGRPSVEPPAQAPRRVADDSGELVGDQVEPADLGDLTAQKLTLLTRRANLRIKQLEAAKRQRLEDEASGDLASVDDFRRYWTTRVAALHQAMRALPDRVARVAGDHYEVVFDAAEQAIDDALMPFGGELEW